MSFTHYNFENYIHLDSSVGILPEYAIIKCNNICYNIGTLMSSYQLTNPITSFPLLGIFSFPKFVEQNALISLVPVFNNESFVKYNDTSFR